MIPRNTTGISRLMSNKQKNKMKTTTIEKIAVAVWQHYSARHGKNKQEFLWDIEAVHKGGADSGIPAFTYFNDTCAFFDKYRSLIRQKLIEDADEYEMSITEMVKSFAVFDGCFQTAKDEADFWAILSGKKTNSELKDHFKNGLCFYALEEASNFIIEDKKGNIDFLLEKEKGKTK